jgi:hypothetical protein
VEGWAIATIVLAIAVVIGILARDTTRNLLQAGGAIREAKARRAKPAAEAERLHRLTHLDDRDGEGR